MLSTIHDAARRIYQKETTPTELLEQCFARIDALEDRVHAWVMIDREAVLRVAKEREQELDQKRYRGPLHGIPIGIKDIYDVFDWPTAAGSRLWQNSIARQDADSIRKLRQAGAIFLGKTVTTQYASFDPPVTRNPWNNNHTPGGSSSGSAAAVACGMCFGATASQTGGSITRPATFCGVAGIKPTFGRVSLDGIVPLSPSMDHPGPMANCVRDLAILLQVMEGRTPDSDDLEGWFATDYLARMDRDSGQPPVLGRLRGIFEERAEPVTRDMMDRVCEELLKAGATIDDVALPASFSEMEARHRIVMAVEAAAYHEPRLRDHPEDYDPKIRSLIEEGLACPAPELSRTKDHQNELRNSMLTCFEEVDALIMPAATGPAPIADSTGDPIFNSPWSYVGYPTISFRSGWAENGLPLGIQVVGDPWSEPDLFPIAEWCEKTLNVPTREVPGT